MTAVSIILVPLAGIGAVTLLYTTYTIIRFFTFHLPTPAHPLQSYKRAGSPAYALITGSSAGIGFGIAQSLVKEGFSPILLGNLPDELSQARVTLLKIRPDAEVRILVMDARTATTEEMRDVVQSIADLPVSILVNNVGGNPIQLPAFRTMATYTCEDVDAVINMNARFMARFTALMLPILSRKAGLEERSLILNMSSAASVGIPWLIMYGATKAFDLAFSIGLARELEAYPETAHVDCLAIIPGEVHSQGNSHGVAASEPRWDYFAQLIVEKVDGTVRRGEKMLRPYAMHDFKDRVFAALPEGVRTSALIDALRHKRDSSNAAYEKSH